MSLLRFSPANAMHAALNSSCEKSCAKKQTKTRACERTSRKPTVDQQKPAVATTVAQSKTATSQPSNDTNESVWVLRDSVKKVKNNSNNATSSNQGGKKNKFVHYAPFLTQGKCRTRCFLLALIELKFKMKKSLTETTCYKKCRKHLGQNESFSELDYNYLNQIYLLNSSKTLKKKKNNKRKNVSKHFFTIKN